MFHTIIGLSFYGREIFQSPTSSINNFHYLELKNMLVDEVHVRDKTTIAIEETKVINDDLTQGTIT